MTCSACFPTGRAIDILELAPRYWRITRARLDRTELDREIGWLTNGPRAAAADDAAESDRGTARRPRPGTEPSDGHDPEA